MLAAPAGFADEIATKTIELEWEDVPGASSYVVKLEPISEKGRQPIYFTPNQARLVEAVPVGVYELRIRSRGKEDDALSPWSDPVTIEVLVKRLEPTSPPDQAVIEAKGKLADVVEFAWTPVDKVKEYTITVWTSDAKDKPFTFKTKNKSKRLTVKTGREYYWQVRFESATDVMYAQEPRTFSFTLVGSKLITPTNLSVTRVNDEHHLAWSPTQDAKTYEAKLSFRFLDETQYRPLKEIRVDGPLW
ncbi:MAG: hypothetical protein HC902_06110 [Calothrix sp. SM1_5_4]|nr:hypothetical protein [Calothrix sp. SM1_5_4]